MDSFCYDEQFNLNDINTARTSGGDAVWTPNVLISTHLTEGPYAGHRLFIPVRRFHGDTSCKLLAMVTSILSFTGLKKIRFYGNLNWAIHTQVLRKVRSNVHRF